MVRLADRGAKRMSEHGRTDFAASGRPNGPGAGRERCAGGEHIVDHECTGWWGCDATDIGRRPEPRLATAPDLARTVAARETGRALEPRRFGEGSRDQLGGVETAQTPSRRSAGHGEDRHPVRRPGSASSDRLARDKREREPTLELQRRNQPSCHSFVGGSEADDP